MTTVIAAKMPTEILSSEETHVLTLYADLPRLRAVLAERQAALAPFPETLWDSKEFGALRTLRDEAREVLTDALIAVMESKATSNAVFSAKIGLFAQRIPGLDSVAPGGVPHQRWEIATDAGMAKRILCDLISRGHYTADAVAA